MWLGVNCSDGCVLFSWVCIVGMVIMLLGVYCVVGYELGVYCAVGYELGVYCAVV